MRERVAPQLSAEVTRELFGVVKGETLLLLNSALILSRAWALPTLDLLFADKVP